MNSEADTKTETPTEHDDHHHYCGRRRFWKFPLIALAIAGFLALKGALIMVLWNFTVPELFHGPTLVYAQALALMILTKLLVGFGFGMRRFGRHHHHRHGHPFWTRMSREEREKLREEIHRKWHR